MAESPTLVSLMLQALKAAPVQAIFARDPYESRRTALKGETLLHVLVIYQTIQHPCLRGLVRATEEHAPLQEALGGPGARNTLSNALAHRPVEQRLEAGRLLKDRYGPAGERWGKQFARIALIDSSLRKLSLAAYAWAA